MGPGNGQYMTESAKHLEHITLAAVGLSPERPFRFCTRHTYAHEASASFPGDEAAPLEGSGLERAYRVNVAGGSTAPHNHEFYEILIVRDGSARHVSSDGERVVRRGDVVVVTPSGWHGYADGDGFAYTNLYMQPDWLLEDLRGLWSEEGLIRTLVADTLFAHSIHDGLVMFRMSEAELSSCEAEVDRMAEEAAKARPSLTLYNGCFLKILWALNEGYGRDVAPVALDLVREAWQAARWIEQRIREGSSLDVNALARQVGKSRHRLSEQFQAAAGMSISEYYQARRMHLAARHLLQPGASVTQTAHRFGFTDAAHFGRMFRKRYGQPPSAYRSERQEAQ